MPKQKTDVKYHYDVGFGKMLSTGNPLLGFSSSYYRGAKQPMPSES